MSALYPTAAVPGTLYIGGRAVATLGKYPIRAQYDAAGEHILFAPHAARRLPVAREVRTAGEDAPAGLEGLRAILWPGGALEMHIDPPRADPPDVVETAPFLQGRARLLRGGGIFLEAEEVALPVGQGPSCGLRPLPGGWIGAFAQEGEGEALLIAAPSLRGIEAVLHVRGEKVFLSGDGARVRVHEFQPPGALHHAVREYLRAGDRYVAQPPSVVPSAQSAITPYELVCALTAAVQLGAQEEALSFLSPSLRSVVDGPTLRGFFGPFDSYIEPRHAAKPRGMEMLALLTPKNGAHIARPFAFEVVRDSRGAMAVENIKVWE